MRNLFSFGISLFKGDSSKAVEGEMQALPLAAVMPEVLADEELNQVPKLEIPLESIEIESRTSIREVVEMSETKPVEIPASLFVSSATPQSTPEESETIEVAVPVKSAEPAKDVTLMVRGSIHYATCPHCQSTWNIKQRLTDPRRVHATSPKDLSCPGCKGAVKLPDGFDLRKLH